MATRHPEHRMAIPDVCHVCQSVEFMSLRRSATRATISAARDRLSRIYVLCQSYFTRTTSGVAPVFAGGRNPPPPSRFHLVSPRSLNTIEMAMEQTIAVLSLPLCSPPRIYSSALIRDTASAIHLLSPSLAFQLASKSQSRERMT